MIITGGHFRGRRVTVPIGHDVRPTPARVKEALFSILAPRILDANVLDLFAGTGALGLEALSRGAARAHFVEHHKQTAMALRATLAHFGLSKDQATVFPLQAERVVQRLPMSYDLVFADPPYALEPPIALFRRLLDEGRLTTGSFVMYEHAADAAGFDPGPFTLIRREQWGEVGISFLTPTTSLVEHNDQEHLDT